MTRLIEDDTGDFFASVEAVADEVEEVEEVIAALMVEGRGWTVEDESIDTGLIDFRASSRNWPAGLVGSEGFASEVGDEALESSLLLELSTEEEGEESLMSPMLFLTACFLLSSSNHSGFFGSSDLGWISSVLESSFGTGGFGGGGFLIKSDS